jgi:Tol biopolymer transport system component
VDARTDVWAFGCVLYEMLAGRAAFAGETLTDILAAIVKGDPDWSALPPETPPAIRRLLRRCLVKDPSDRLHAIADARFEIAEAQTEPTALAAPPPFASPRRERALTMAAGAGIVASLAMAVPTVRYFRGVPQPSTDPAAEVRLEITTPPTMDPISMALSPNGRMLTFVASDNGTQRLWLRPLDSETAQPLPGTEAASYPFWSPDSRAIGFAARGKLKRLDIGGGQPRTLTDVAGYRGGSWNPDDVIVFAAGGAVGLRRVSASSGEVTQATQNTLRQTNHRFPQFLPDGRYFTFFSQGSNEAAGVFLGTLDSLESKRLTPADTAAAYLPPDKVLYGRQGSLVARKLDRERGVLDQETVTVADRVGWDGAIGVGAFSVSRTGIIAYRAGGPGRRHLAWFDRSGRQTSVVGSPDPNSLQYPELSRDGKRVAVDRTVLNNRDIYFADTTSGEPIRISLDPQADMSPIWSPDGGRIVFRSNRTGVPDLYQKSTRFEGAETLLYDSPEAKTPNAWSPDGRFILFVSTGLDTGNDIWVLPVGSSAGDAKPWALVRTPSDESQATFSPGGNWIAYQSDEGGPLDIYVQPFPGPGEKRQISNGGGAQPRWGRDGKEIFYLTPDDKLMAVPIRVQGASLDRGTPVALFQPPLSGTAFSGLAGNIRPQYDVAPDGRFLMNVMTEETTSPITVILNWSGLLKH